MTDVVPEELRLLREIARWTREAALPEVRSRVHRLVDTDGKKRAYAQMASGTGSLMAIERTTGVNHNDVRKWVNGWEAEGLVEAGSSPPRASFTLVELGIEPAPPRPERTRRVGDQ